MVRVNVRDRTCPRTKASVMCKSMDRIMVMFRISLHEEEEQLVRVSFRVIVVAVFTVGFRVKFRARILLGLGLGKGLYSGLG